MLGTSKTVVCLYAEDTDSIRTRTVSCVRGLSRSVGAKLGTEPDRVSVGGGTRFVAHKLYNLARAEKKLDAEEACGALDYMSLIRVPDDERATACFDWDCVFEGGHFGNDGLVMLLVGFDNSKFSCMHGVDYFLALEGIWSELLSIAEFGYGFCTSMPTAFLPDGYAIGSAGSGPDKLVWDANSWRRGACRSGLERIRNVHPVNFVNQRQLAQMIGNVPLKEWIARNPARGSLRSVGQGLYQWVVADDSAERTEATLRWDNPYLFSVRKQLEEFGVFPWQEFIAKFPGRNSNAVG